MGGLLGALILTLTGGGLAAQAPSQPPITPPHVMVIVEENRSESSVIGSSDAPYVNSLASRYGFASASYGQSHPSLPNYLELLSGSTWGVGDDGTGYSFPGPTLVDQLAERGISWRAYMESMPAPCYGGASSGNYAKKHNPFMYFRSITDSAAQCRNVVPFDAFAAEVQGPSPPDFIWVTPNLCDDGHDCSTSTVDTWLAAHLQPVLSSSWFAHEGVVIITWDEGSDGSGCCGGASGGHIATIVITAGSPSHSTSAAAVDHAGTLRTVEELYALPPLGDAGCGCSGSLAALLGTRKPPATAP